MLGFILGLFIGGIIGVGMMAILNCSRDSKHTELFNLYDLENQEKDDVLENRKK